MKINFKNTKHIQTAGRIEQLPKPEYPEIVLAGRSNVGKSSLINALGNNKNLARVSSSPGKTRLILYFLVDNAFILTDLPGYGYAKADRSTIEGFNQLTDDYLTSDRPMKLVLFLLDARHKPSENDEMMFEFLNEIGLPYVVVLTKTDKMSRSQLLQRVREFRKLDYIGEEGAVFPISSSKKSGLEDLKVFLGEYIGNINDQ